jgi:ribosomal protein S18 acetylase RimI-like enzyme
MIKIRSAKLKDCKKCSELSKIKELKTADNSFISENYFRCFVDTDDMFFVAEEKENVIGYLLGEPLKGNLAFLSLLTVDKEHRNKGIGKKLIDRFKKRCDKKKLNYLVLYAPEFNKKTHKFYKSNNFIQGKKLIQFIEER